MLGIEDVLILGASTRAAAFSAARAGLRPRCLDLFADADLAAFHPVVRFDPDRDADDLERIAAALGFTSWMYTGSIEGRPDLVERLSAMGRLLGNGPDTLRRVRDPWRVSATLRASGFPVPALRAFSERTLADERTWLLKSSATAGGTGVSWAVAAEGAGDPSSYLQEFVDGPTFSGLFVGAAGAARLLGVARQERGGPGSPFHYRGSFAPWPVDPALTADLRRIGEVLAAEFQLVGLFGVDFIVNDERPWVVEVNPRYTASVELFEGALRRALVEDHYRACVHGDLGREASLREPARIVGKRVLYADRALVVPDLGLVLPYDDDPYESPLIADVPHPGTKIRAGEPVVTCFAFDATPESCVKQLDGHEAGCIGWLSRYAEPIRVTPSPAEGEASPSSAGPGPTSP